MKVVSTKVDLESYERLLSYCRERGISVSSCLSDLVNGLLSGKADQEKTMEKRLVERINAITEVMEETLSNMDWCPECGHVLHLHRSPQVTPHLECISCGYYGGFREPEWHQGEDYEV